MLYLILLLQWQIISQLIVVLVWNAVRCGTSARHTWSWTFNFWQYNRCFTPALATWCGQTHACWILLSSTALGLLFAWVCCVISQSGVRYHSPGGLSKIQHAWVWPHQVARAGVKQRLYYQKSRSSMSRASTTSQIIPHDTTMSFAMICHCNTKIKYNTNTSRGKPGFKSYMHCHQQMMWVYSALQVLLEFRPFAII